jgi:SAM-dependent methyltransferase
MPGSFPVFDAVVRQLVTLLAPQRALDIGAGAGKYGRMLAELAPGCHREGIELEPRYVQAHGLDTLYHRLHVADATQWWQQHPGEDFDLVLAGDCIEHLPKSAGLDLLNAMVYRCGYLVLLAPEFIVQGAVDGVAAERHLSVWSERDLHWHDLWAWDNCRATTLLLLRGYQPAPLPLEALVDQLNAADLPVRHFDGQTLVRPARLRLVAQRREVDYRLP